jgi:hypothetical protein
MAETYPRKAKRKVMENTAGKILAKVIAAKAFRCNDGQVFRDLKGLAEGLERMSDETFSFHCNDNKNDFSIWVLEVVGDDDLAKKLKAPQNRQQAQKQVKQRYDELFGIEDVSRF